MSRPASGQNNLLSLSWIVTIGKHKGEKLEDVIHSDPNWVRWATSEIPWFNLDKEASEQLDLSEYREDDLPSEFDQDFKDAFEF